MLAEQRSPQSFDITWECSKIMYECCQTLCYGFASLCTAPCMAGFWGCEFAYLAFSHIWIYGPFVKNVKYCAVDTIQRCLKAVINCCVVPWTTACGRVFYLIHVARKPKDPEPRQPLLANDQASVPGQGIYAKPSADQLSKSIQRQLRLFLR